LTDPRYDRVIHYLSDVYTSQGIDIWLNSPNSRLNGSTPSMLMACGTNEEWDKVLAEAERLVWI